ncbi:hypothetical protein GPECTOR_18g171 [Gonium pectorale]|uniref:phytol kinase n=1 Tax=Gonium pectorale TaxID=33097 RepID=A0A150GJM1_GONPE|nr:hypothetical protein GPECTOR_18g171 [Gonium pectorale]|eukprot:KXZ50018.1 hypothetical protein GPECTOR_18g171 [Gonium pectorale]
MQAAVYTRQGPPVAQAAVGPSEDADVHGAAAVAAGEAFRDGLSAGPSGGSAPPPLPWRPEVLREVATHLRAFGEPEVAADAEALAADAEALAADAEALAADAEALAADAEALAADAEALAADAEALAADAEALAADAEALAADAEALAADAEALAAYLERGGAGACAALRLSLPESGPLAAALFSPAEARRLLPGRGFNPACANLEGDSEAGLTLKSCAGCGAVGYCCRPCQLEHWRAGHKGACGRARGRGA